MSALFKPKALQDPVELEQFVHLLRRESVRSYLEIGSKYGGSLWRIGNALPTGSRLVSVELPMVIDSLPHLQECVRHLRNQGQDVHLFVGDSTKAEIVEMVRALGPYDCCLIDGDHTEPYVRKDWEHYGAMARIVAFHDIGWKPDNRPPHGYKIEVPKVWADIKRGFRHQEILACYTGQDNGFGIIFR